MDLIEKLREASKLLGEGFDILSDLESEAETSQTEETTEEIGDIAASLAMVEDRIDALRVREM